MGGGEGLLINVVSKTVASENPKNSMFRKSAAPDMKKTIQKLQSRGAGRGGRPSQEPPRGAPTGARSPKEAGAEA